MKRSICVVITARPSYSRIKSVLREIHEHPDLELQLIVSGSALLDKYGSVIDVIRADGFEPNAQVHMVVEGENLVTSAKSTGLGIMEMSTVLSHLKPDAVLSVADRYETIATAITGAYMNIPVIHVQGGEVTGSIDEKVRHAVTKLADLHLVSNQDAAERVRRMGEEPASIHITGCPSIDLAADVMQKQGFLNKKEQIKGVGAEIELKEPYLVVMQHPVTYEWEDAGDQIIETLHAIDALNIPTLWLWPNVDAGSDAASRAIRKFRENNGTTPIRFVKNIPPEPFLELLSGAKCLIGNSSVGIRECSYLGVPVVNIGSRQSGRGQGPNVLDIGHDRKKIQQKIELQIEHGRYSSSSLYGNGNSGVQIADLLSKVTFNMGKRITY
ncbi:MAG: UDP-N-acetylglucosamine 2-epimerase (hydrolyzing) [SAR324 cluster bacterium]|uniref:UDP-N-acetylglucosamine 2-epimerase (Hydrolyzing) n=1 Tax=SAR324 cluster bacterium TaxID=2024889 RepID=A0A2A4T6U8_9DELT|nr:MAG: UDP-N-acetylglucosamine 2-epimerase (hydrolyzing) [SAR324 cluster bacterium]